MPPGTATRADEDEISYSVAVITLFGMIALFTYPFLAHWLFHGNAEHVGLFLGTAIHDTSQVAAAGLMYQLYYDSPLTLEVAATTKLVRNIFMGLVIPIMAVTYQRRHAVVASAKVPIFWLKWSQWIPPFLIGFFALALLRSIGDIGQEPFGILPPEFWESLISLSGAVSIFFLFHRYRRGRTWNQLIQIKGTGMESPLYRFLRRIYRGRSQLFLGNPTLLMNPPN